MEKRRAAERAEKKRLWENRLKDWNASGLTQSQYCREHGLRVNQFIYWKKRVMPGTVTLVEVPTPKPLRSSSAISLVIGEHYRLEIPEGFDPASLERVIRVVSRL